MSDDGLTWRWIRIGLTVGAICWIVGTLLIASVR